jgi:hypothetical protein
MGEEEEAALSMGGLVIHALKMDHDICPHKQ